MKPFYLIAHNPNTVDEAVRQLQLGANAIEPDVYFDGGQFYMMEMIPVWNKIFPPKKGPLLQDYFTQLKSRIQASQATATPLNLKLILLDTKNIDHYRVQDLFAAMRSAFALPNVKVAITTGSSKCLTAFNGVTLANDELVGIDGGCKASEADTFFKSINSNYTYANGTSLPLISTTASVYSDQIKAALRLRDDPANQIKPTLVYAWTVNGKSSMQYYLRLGVDGIITDKIQNAVELLKAPEFSGVYSTV